MGLSDGRHLLAILSVGSSADGARRLVVAVRALAKAVRAHPKRFKSPLAPRPHYRDLTVELVIPAAEAFAGPTEQVPWEEAAGRVAAEVIAPAPPGVPRLIPGQRITPAHVAFLIANRGAGMFVLDPSDPDEKKIRVVRRP